MRSFEIVAAADAPEAVAFVATRLSDEDAAEVRALARFAPKLVVDISVKVSHEAFVALIDGTPAAVFGVGDTAVLGGAGVPWLLGTAQTRTAPRHLLAGGRAFCRRWLKRYTLLENVVSDRHVAAVRWIGHLGFTLDDPYPVRAGVYVRRFWMRRGQETGSNG